jgi:hypothetical protein
MVVTGYGLIGFKLGAWLDGSVYTMTVLVEVMRQASGEGAASATTEPTWLKAKGSRKLLMMLERKADNIINECNLPQWQRDNN